MMANLGEGFGGWVRVFAGLGMLGSLLLMSGCADEDGPYLMTQEFATKGDAAEDYRGGQCMPVDAGNGSGAGTGPAAGAGAGELGYEYSWEGVGDGVHFVFKDGAGEVLAERNYNSAFIASGQKDEVKVTVGEDTLRFVNWGSHECEEILDPSADD